VSAILSPSAAQYLRDAGAVQVPPKKDRAADDMRAICAQIADLSARLDALSGDQLEAVIEAASAARRNSESMATAIATLLKDRPKKNEAWNFTVTKRDKDGRIETLRAEQVA